MFFTQEGEYFYCEIDGVPYKPKGAKGWHSLPPIRITVTDTSVSIKTYDDNYNVMICVFDNTGVKKDSYLLSGNPNKNLSRFYLADGTTYSFHSDSIHTGIISINKLDFDKKIIEGKFESKCYSIELNKSASITKGSFSLNFE